MLDTLLLVDMIKALYMYTFFLIQNINADYKDLIQWNRHDGLHKLEYTKHGRNGIENVRVTAEIAFLSRFPDSRSSAAISISRVFPAPGDTIDWRVIEK